MSKFQKIFPIIIIFLALTSISYITFASSNKNNKNIEVINNSQNITDETKNEIINEINNSLVNDNDNATITINDNDNENNIYDISVEKKIYSDAKTKNDEGVTASMLLMIELEDKKGPVNVLKNIKGEVDIYNNSGKIEKSSITIGSIGTSYHTIDLGKETNFDKDFDIPVTNINVIYSVLFENTKSELKTGVSKIFN